MNTEIIKKLVQLLVKNEAHQNNPKCDPCLQNICNSNNENQEFGCFKCILDCIDEGSQISESTNVESQPLLENFKISGEIVKMDENHKLPLKLGISWFNFMEGDDVRDGTAWQWTGGEDVFNETHFQIQVVQ